MIVLLTDDILHNLSIAQLPNGIDSNAFKDGENKPDMFVYGSAPNRGLRAGESALFRP